MEGDSVHICIEKALKMQDMNIPEDYISVIRNARVKWFPYQVRFNSLLPHTFFKDYALVKDIPQSDLAPKQVILQSTQIHA